MTDKDRLKSMLEDFGIGFKDDDSQVYYPNSIIICKEGFDKVHAHSDFYAYFEFKPDGKFMHMGIYE